mgnify:CR=1 FL=1
MICFDENYGDDYDDAVDENDNGDEHGQSTTKKDARQRQERRQRRVMKFRCTGGLNVMDAFIHGLKRGIDGRGCLPLSPSPSPSPPTSMSKHFNGTDTGDERDKNGSEEENEEEEAHALHKELQNSQQNESILRDEIRNLSSQLLEQTELADMLRDNLSAKDDITKGLKKQIRASENDKSVLMARMQALENKAGKVKELEKKAEKVGKFRQELKSLEKGNEELKLEVEGCKEKIVEMGKAKEFLKSQLEQSLERERSSRQEIASLSSQVSKLSEQLEGTARIIAERNSLRSKASALSKDLAVVCGDGRGVQQVRICLDDYDSIKVKNRVLEAELRQARDEVHEYKMGVEEVNEIRRRQGWEGEAERALTVKAELERIVQSLSDQIGDKDLQIDTMRDVNKRLAGEIEELKSETRGGVGEI